MTTSPAAADITVEDALAALHAVYNRPPMRPVHCFAGSIGADWNMTGVEEAIRQSTRRAWVDHPLGHNLAVRTPEGRLYHFDVAGPAEIPAPTPRRQPPARLHPTLYPIMVRVQAALAEAVSDTRPGVSDTTFQRPLLADVSPRDRRRLAALAVEITAWAVADDLAERCLALSEGLDGTQRDAEAQLVAMAAAQMCRAYARTQEEEPDA